MEAVDVIQLSGLSFYFAAVQMATLALATMAVVAMTTVVFGLSFFSSSAVADVVETASANKLLNEIKTGGNVMSPVFIFIISKNHVSF